ncbi:putative Rad51 [Trypanosoma vivax]|uniref:Putative DNA repair protein n=1 Tax=Trypanosoma vivax (strain Y486) TaxID=1055687 RepID=G0TTK9_TRYVY|nr:putative DNA repair protein [Trypanosoma vivax]KAH8606961.1 putative Rad51 [Trypanosoma vivax]CCC47290.1 putative DNA repair protein [Trypanosoma vivax Y486]
MKRAYHGNPTTLPVRGVCYWLQSLNGHLEDVLLKALIMYCQQWNIRTEADLLLSLTADKPSVQRWLQQAMKKGNQRHLVAARPATLNSFIEYVTRALSTRHISEIRNKSPLMARHGEGFGIASIVTSVADLLSRSPKSHGAPTMAGAASYPEKCPAFFTTGCDSLDRLLAGSLSTPPGSLFVGGFGAGFLTEVYGEAGSGKTQLVIQCLLHCIVEHKCAVLVSEALGCELGRSAHADGVAAFYIVSESVHAARLMQLTEGVIGRVKERVHRYVSHLPSSTVGRLTAQMDKTLTTRSVLEGLKICEVGSAKVLLQLISSGALSRLFSAQCGRGVVVVDSIAALGYHGSVKDDENDGAKPGSDIAAVGALLKAFAVQEGAAVIVTNQVRSLLMPPDGGAMQWQGAGRSVPALGMGWCVAPHIRVHLQCLARSFGTVRRQLTVVCGPAHQPACGTYTIRKEGIFSDE